MVPGQPGEAAKERSNYERYEHLSTPGTAEVAGMRCEDAFAGPLARGRSPGAGSMYSRWGSASKTLYRSRGWE
jgi:hypothetical protein